jgi:DNA polymerase III subunit delta'
MSLELIGNERVAHLLHVHAATNRLKHAYLFTGPAGVGRRTLALKLAQAVNCPTPDSPGSPCGICSTCKRIMAMQHPDLILVQAENKGGMIKVDQIRELQRFLSLSPYEARYRFALLLRFEEANPNASNALLKSLEEPSPQVILALTAESPESLLPTIVSRCETLRLAPLPVNLAAEKLSSLLNIPPERALFLAHLSNGRPGYALHLQNNPDSLETRKVWLDDLQNLLASNRFARFAYAEELSKDKEKLRQVLLIWFSFWRDVLLTAAGASAPITNLDREDEIQALAAQLNLKRVYKTVTAIEDTLALLERNINVRLAMEVFFLRLPSL